MLMVRAGEGWGEGKMKILGLLLILLFTSPAFAWDAVGHKLIALIAYQHLNPQARYKIDQLTLTLDPNYPAPQRFLYGAVWADYLREHDHRFVAAHYIDYLHPAAENLVQAIDDNQMIIHNDAHYSLIQRAEALRFLIHFLGDIHQPLHCREDYRGGNLYWIQTPAREIISLHAYWDDGLGLFQEQNKHYPLDHKQIRVLAKRIQRDYPQDFFKDALTKKDPHQWAKESFLLAKDFSYQVNQYALPSSAYRMQGQQIVEQRIALAGYRLAELLNQILG
jgi:hypothetical protein